VRRGEERERQREEDADRESAADPSCHGRARIAAPGGLGPPA
jgi:hypothetical protein